MTIVYRINRVLPKLLLARVSSPLIENFKTHFVGSKRRCNASIYREQVFLSIHKPMKPKKKEKKKKMHK